MRVSNIRSPDALLIAYDREAHCTRLVMACETEIVDSQGLPVRDYLDVDTERGMLWRRDAAGRKVTVFGKFCVVVKQEVAARLARRR